MPGEDVSEALGAAKQFAEEKIATVFTQLGERVTSTAECDAVRDHYLDLFDEIQRRGLPSHVSVKLTQLGLDIDRDACAARVRTLADKAVATGSFLWVDIEESHYVDATLAVYRVVRAANPKVGLCLQAYLYRTPDDLRSLLPLKPSIRLVKGAYREPPTVAFPKKQDTDRAFESIANEMLDAAAHGNMFPVFGTHDMRIIDAIVARAKSLALAKNAYELHMLYGIRMDQQRRLAASGVVVRDLISYGTHWFPWYMRRLAERPANVWFVVRSVFSS
jgi:proline dehydrogenase